jgi:membrane-anchored protein YejM (alkaline phosphatase superfamily)
MWLLAALACHGTTPRADGTAPAVVPPAFTFRDGRLPRNLIWITLDTARRDFVSRYGGEENTPNLDRVLAEGVALDDHRSCSNWTGPSMVCLFSGLTPLERAFWPWSEDPLVADEDPELPTLAGGLAAAGWATTMVTASSVLSRVVPHGFQTVELRDRAPASEISAVALEELARLSSGTRPYYLHVHYTDPHAPYCPPDSTLDAADLQGPGRALCTDWGELYPDVFLAETPEWQAAFTNDARELYDAEIEAWDLELGLLWEVLEANGALDSALVVFATDHGEQFFERERFEHGQELLSEENRAVAGFWARELVAAPWAGPTVHQDLPVTLEGLYGVVRSEPGSGVPIGAAPADRVVEGLNFWSFGPPEVSVVSAGRQLAYDWEGTKEAYDLVADPAATTDLYDAAAVEDLWVPLNDLVDRLLAQWPHLGEPPDRGP